LVLSGTFGPGKNISFIGFKIGLQTYSMHGWRGTRHLQIP